MFALVGVVTCQDGGGCEGGARSGDGGVALPLGHLGVGVTALVLLISIPILYFIRRRNYRKLKTHSM